MFLALSLPLSRVVGAGAGGGVLHQGWLGEWIGAFGHDLLDLMSCLGLPTSLVHCYIPS